MLNYLMQLVGNYMDDKTHSLMFYMEIPSKTDGVS